jgi:2-methylcitrate dehydratase PrpD
MKRSHAEELADYVANHRYDDLPREAIHQAKRCLLDSLGVAIAGCKKKWAQAVLAEVRRQRTHGGATVWLYGDRVPDAAAAMVNGMFAHSMDFNDDHAGIQVGGLIPPSALAVAEDAGASPKDLLLAIVLGYDVAIRIADAINSQELYMRGFQPTAVCGAFAAAAVAGKLLRLKSSQISDAFGIAASYAGGTREFLRDGTDTKRFHVAKAAHGGVLSARLAAGGMTGPRTVFEGEAGVFAVYSALSFPERLVAELGRRYDILDTSFKRYPFCDGNAAPLEATLEILRENQIDLEDIQSLRYRMKSFLMPYVIEFHGDRTRKFRPHNELDAQMSLPYCISVGLLNNGNLQVEDFDPVRFDDPRIHTLSDKVDAEADSELDKVPLRPMSMPAIATVTTRRGASFTRRVDYQKGDPRNPFSSEELITKFHSCVQAHITRECAEQVVDEVQHIEERNDLAQLTHLLGSLARRAISD